MRKYHNYIKRSILKEYIKSPSRVLDLASGKGGDINKYITNKFVKSVRGYDIDKDSVKEAKSRLENYKNNTKSIRFFVKDLSKNVLSHYKFEIIVVQFAFHYFFSDAKSFENIIETINNSSKKDTILIITVLDDELLDEMSTENIEIKYKRSVASKSVFGKEIDVWIKDSVLSEPTTEYIVDKIFMLQKFQSIGFELVDYIPFKEMYKSFTNSVKGSCKLSPEEKKYSFMNSVFVFGKFG
jgi:SAM-dependent methyltransferase